MAIMAVDGAEGSRWTGLQSSGYAERAKEHLPKVVRIGLGVLPRPTITETITFPNPTGQSS